MSRIADKSNIFLAGMMGTGKSSTGRLVAKDLRCVFADTDALIERREHLTISEIFAKYGEGYFRTREHELLAELCEQDRQVIATGGGMLANEVNLQLAQCSGLVVLLTAPASALDHRLRYRNDRPLLAVPDPVERLIEIENRRREVWDTIDYRVDTYGLSPLQVAEQVIAVYREWLES